MEENPALFPLADGARAAIVVRRAGPAVYESLRAKAIGGAVAVLDLQQALKDGGLVLADQQIIAMQRLFDKGESGFVDLVKLFETVPVSSASTL
eukprot:SAG22_NODE_193_length_15643_cov_5.339424_3_plen_94_part_00